MSRPTMVGASAAGSSCSGSCSYSAIPVGMLEMDFGAGGAGARLRSCDRLLFVHNKGLVVNN